MNKKKLAKVFDYTVIVVGAAAVGYSVYNLPLSLLDFRLAIIVAFALFIGSKLIAPVLGAKIVFSFNEAAVFLIFFLYGGEITVLLTLIETFFVSSEIRKRGIQISYRTAFFNSAAMACSFTAASLAVRFFGYLINRPPNLSSASEFVIVVCVAGLTAFIVNSSMIAAHLSLKQGNATIWQTWSERCVGCSLTYVLGVTCGGILYQLVVATNTLAVSLVCGAVTLIYFTYWRFTREINKKVELLEAAKAERDEIERQRVVESEKYIAELSEHIAEQKRISEALRMSKERFQHAAMHDALTGLPNRAFFFEQIRFLLERDKNSEIKRFCVLFMDLDKFKNINDSLGHAIGDKLLVKVARRLEKTVRHGDTVARLGGDEFAIVLAEINSVEGAKNFAQRISRAVSQPFRIDGHQVFTAASVGIALGNNEYTAPEELLRDADIAMYDAKENKTGCSIFDRELRIRAVNTIKLETDLRNAIEKEQFKVYYQPIISLESGFLTGFEALIRWQHPERGLISPLEFIPVAESNGQIVPMTNWILWMACSQLSRWRWRSAANRSLLVSVNLSSKHFTQLDLVDQVKYTLQETGLEPRCLKLELTESAVMENAEEATIALKRLRQIGVQLSIDDFGTGYSSLSYLHKFPIDTLKVDRSFVSRMGANGENTEIVKTIITLSDNLGLDVIAEGVETIDQARKLQQFGCRYAQGYLFSKPLPQEEMDEIMKSSRNWLPEELKPPMQTNFRHTGKVFSLPTGFKN
jgi:diguanylate cyclase (GGDEF)-like protein